MRTLRAVWIVVLMLMGAAAFAQGDNAPSGRPDQSPSPGPVPSPGPAGPPPGSQSPCGAVAYTADGAFGGAFGIASCEEAHRLAVAECVKVSTDKNDCSEGVLTRRDSWFHIQFCQRDRNWTTHVTTRPTLSDTNREAGEWARMSKFGAEYCRLVPNGLFHSGGLHTKL
ncbi:MAG: hypothetical protein IT536_21575 [Hyphomicrobiales bacterium]|nr:hypothetical protein [Hyphomicrobiales bacterium]